MKNFELVLQILVLISVLVLAIISGKDRDMEDNKILKMMKVIFYGIFTICEFTFFVTGSYKTAGWIPWIIPGVFAMYGAINCTKNMH